MKTSTKRSRVLKIRHLLITACAAIIGSANSAHAASGSWTLNGSGNWGDAANWSSGTIADGATFTATFSTLNITTGTRTVTLDTPRTIGTLTMGDNNTTDRRSYLFTGSALTFDNGASNAVLTQIANSNGDTISAPILLNSSLNLTNSANTSGSFTLTLSTGGISAGTAGLKTINVNGSAASNVTMSGVIENGSGSIAIVKNSTGNTLTLSGANTFTGGVTLNAGTLSINNATALGTSTSTLTITGGTLASSGITMTANNPQNWNGDFAFGGGNSLNMGTGAVTLSANRTISIGSTADTLTIGGVIGDGAGTFSLNTANSGAVITGILALNGANTYKGGTNINGGVVRFGSATAIPATGSITVQSGGSLSVSGAHTTLAGWLANAKLSTASTGALSLASATVTENYTPTTHLSLGLGANIGVTTNYTGTYTPTGNGYFVGGGGGTINFSNSGAFVAGKQLTAGNGGGGTVIISGDNAAFDGAVTITNGTLQIGNGGATGSLGTPSSIVNNSNLSFNRSDDLTFGVSISGSGSLTKQGANKLTLTAANTFSGDTVILGGILQLGVTNALLPTSEVNLGNNTTSTGTLDLGTFDQTLSGLTVSSNNNTTANVINIPTGQTLTVNGNVNIGNTTATGNSTQNVQTLVDFTGGGSFIVNNSGGTFNAGINIGTTNNSGLAQVNMAPLANFTANLGAAGTFSIQPNGDNRGGTLVSTLTLSNTANSITAGTLNIGTSGTGASGNAQTLLLGGGTNQLNANTVNLGTGSRDSGALLFAGTSGSLVLRDVAGTGRVTTVTMGPTGNQTTATATNSIIDTTGHLADLAIGTLRTAMNTKSALSNYSVNFDQGTLDIHTLNMAVAQGTAASTSSLNIGGGTVRLGGSAAYMDTGTGAVTLATAATGELKITGGTVTSSVNINKASGTGTAILTLNGGTLDLGSNRIGGTAAANNLTTLNFQSGTLRNVTEINNGAVLNKTTAGALTLAGMNAYTGGTTVTGGTLIAASSSALGTGPVTVAGTGQILAIDGPSAVNVSGIGNLTIPTGNTLRLSEIGDQFTLTTGSVFSLDTITLDLNNAFNLPGTYTVIDGVAGANALLGTTTFVNVDPGLSYSFVLSNDDALLTITAIPEPSTLVLGSITLLGLAGFGWRRQRKTKL